jgi:hypothetical protein
MAKVYIEARPKGRPEPSPIEDYVVEDHADSVLKTFKTQHEAIEGARKQGHHPLSLAFGISMTRRPRITGGQLDEGQPGCPRRIAGTIPSSCHTAISPLGWYLL